MRLGLCTTMRHSSPEEWAKQLYDLGCKTCVFPVNYLAGEDVVDAYAAAAAKYGLTIAEVGIWKNMIAEDPAQRAEAMEYAIGQLRMAERVGAKCCVNIAGAMKGPRWDGAHKDNFSTDAWDLTVKSVQELVDAVKPVRTKYSIEPMPWMIPSGPEEYLGLLEDIDRDCVGVHMDIVNMINCPDRYFFQEEFIEDCFELLGDKILSCHLKDVHLRPEFTFQLQECACGQGELNIELYTQLATKANLDMPMIIEHLNSDEEYIASLKYVQERLHLN